MHRHFHSTENHKGLLTSRPWLCSKPSTNEESPDLSRRPASRGRSPGGPPGSWGISGRDHRPPRPPRRSPPAPATCKAHSVLSLGRALLLHTDWKWLLCMKMKETRAECNTCGSLWRRGVLSELTNILPTVTNGGEILRADHHLNQQQKQPLPYPSHDSHAPLPRSTPGHCNTHLRLRLFLLLLALTALQTGQLIGYCEIPEWINITQR